VSHLPSPRAALRSFLVGQRAQAVAFLAQLVRMPSDNPPGDCAPHAALAARLLEDLGFTVERHAVPQDEARANGMTSCTNLLVRERFGAGPVIACNAHGDVVPPGENWTADPYGAEVRGGRMFGRGVAVSKSDFATYAFAVLALKAAVAAGAKLHGTIELHFTYDEETGGALGPARLLARGNSKPDFALCAGFAYAITVAHNGCLHLEVEVRGKSAHAAHPEEGVDALAAATGLLADLYALRAQYAAIRSHTPGIGSPTLVVGLIEGGINTNVVPDRVVFRLDRRIIPEENPGEVEATLTAQIRASGRRWPGIEVEVRRLLLAAPLLPLPAQQPLVEAIRRSAQEVLGEAIAVGGVPLYTDARHYSAAGVPTVLYGAGPRTLAEANGHRADENLVLGDLHKATDVVALALYDLLAVETQRQQC
jgi:acetylornithine deacetylase/succinyl-diaminopimelate desuccinylase family protein